MELRHLRYFVAVAELANFTRAARRLRVAQPALGRQMTDLEEELGVTLLERGPRGAGLTAAGELFLPEARAVLERAAAAALAMREFAAGSRGDLRIGYAPSPTVELLPRILHAFQSEAPSVRVRLGDLSTGEMIAGLRDGSLDAALLVRPGTGAAEDLVFDELVGYPVCAALPRGHRLLRARHVTLRQLAAEPLVSYTRADYPEHRAWLEELFGGSGLSPRVVEEHDSANSLIAAVEAGRGLALVLWCFGCLAGPRLRLRELDPAPEPFSVGVAYRRARLGPAAKRFIHLLTQIREGLGAKAKAGG